MAVFGIGVSGQGRLVGGVEGGIMGGEGGFSARRPRGELRRKALAEVALAEVALAEVCEGELHRR